MLVSICEGETSATANKTAQTERQREQQKSSDNNNMTINQKSSVTLCRHAFTSIFVVIPDPCHVILHE